MTAWWEYVSAGLSSTGMSKSDLAIAVGVARSTVTNWDTKGAMAESHIAKKVAAAFGDPELRALQAAGHAPVVKDDAGPVGAGVSPVDMSDLDSTQLERVRGFVEGLRAARG